MQSPFEMANLLSRIMARKGPDSEQTEPLHAITLKNGTKVAINMSSPLYKRARDALFKRFIKVARERNLTLPLPQPDLNSGRVDSSHLGHTLNRMLSDLSLNSDHNLNSIRSDPEQSLDNTRSNTDQKARLLPDTSENRKGPYEYNKLPKRKVLKTRRKKYRKKLKPKRRDKINNSGYHLMDMSLLKPKNPHPTSQRYDDVIGPYRHLGDFGNMIDEPITDQSEMHDNSQDQSMYNRGVYGSFLGHLDNVPLRMPGNQVESPLHRLQSNDKGLMQVHYDPSREHITNNQNPSYIQNREYKYNIQQPLIMEQRGYNEQMDHQSINGFNDYSPSAYRSSMGRYAKTGEDEDVVHKEPELRDEGQPNNLNTKTRSVSMFFI